MAPTVKGPGAAATAVAKLPRLPSRGVARQDPLAQSRELRNGLLDPFSGMIFTHMRICQNLRVREYIRMGHEKLKPCKATGHPEKRHP